MILYVYTIHVPYIEHPISTTPLMSTSWATLTLAELSGSCKGLARWTWQNQSGDAQNYEQKHGGFNQYITYITNINWLYIYLGTYVIIHNQLFIGELKIGLMQNNNQQNQQTPQLDLSCFRTTGRVMLCKSNLNWLNFNIPLCLCRD